MSAAKEYDYEQEMMQEVQRVQELMSESSTGKEMMEASAGMAGTEEMNQLMILIGDPKIREEERMLLAQYMGEMLKRDPVRGMELYADYLKNVAAMPEYASKGEYYLSVSQAALKVNNTAEYKKYIESYQKFEEDDSPEAIAAKEATDLMQERMKQWSGYDQTQSANDG